MNSESSPNSELSQPPAEPKNLPPLPWKEGIEVVLARYERRILDLALTQSNGVKRRAALLLGISRYALERRLTRVARTLDKADARRAGSVSSGSASMEVGRASSMAGDR